MLERNLLYPTTFSLILTAAEQELKEADAPKILKVPRKKRKQNHLICNVLLPYLHFKRSGKDFLLLLLKQFKPCNRFIWNWGTWPVSANFANPSTGCQVVAEALLCTAGVTWPCLRRRVCSATIGRGAWNFGLWCATKHSTNQKIKGLRKLPNKVQAAPWLIDWLI